MLRSYSYLHYSIICSYFFVANGFQSAGTARHAKTGKKLWDWFTPMNCTLHLHLTFGKKKKWKTFGQILD